MAHNLLDLTLLLQVLQAPPGEGAVDLEPVDEGGDRHETVRLDVLVELVGSGLVKDDRVLGLVLDCGRNAELAAVAVAARGICTGQKTAGAEEQRLPFPFDHFFFCFFAPVAAGAILDVCSGGWMKGWSRCRAAKAGRVF